MLQKIGEMGTNKKTNKSILKIKSGGRKNIKKSHVWRLANWTD